jgi:hypothetical protein
VRILTAMLLIGLFLLLCVTFAGKPVKVDLKDLIETETQIREEEDRILQNNIDTETATRQADDAALQGQIDDINNSNNSGMLEVYDGDDQAVGFTYGEDNTILTAEGYHFIVAWNSEGTIYPGERNDGWFFINTIYFSGAYCTGTMYVEPYYHLAGRGRVESPFTDAGLYYIPLEATKITLTPVSFATVGLPAYCHDYILGAIEMYELLPNEPSITGVQNSYQGPLSVVYVYP